MNIRTQTSRDTITIERAAVTQSETGGQLRTYSTSARGDLPTSARCRIVPLRPEEQIAFGVRGVRSAWKLLFSFDPVLTIADRVRFIEPAGNERIARIVEPSHDLDRQGRLFRSVARESENEQ